MIDNRLEIIVEIPNSAVSTPDNPNGITRYNLDTFPPEQQEPIEINYCINDINDISNRNASSSKTIILPETDNNRKVFGFISDLNLQVNTFSPNKRAKCFVMLDTIVVLEGWLQLKNIKPNYRTGLTKLECVVYSNQMDFFKAVGEKYLQDLQGFNQMTYKYDSIGITSSWFKSQEKTDVYFPLIDYGIGYDNKYQETSTSFNAVSVGADGGSGFVNYIQMYPAVYLKSIIDAIFHSANSESYTDPSTGLSSSTVYQYNSDFFNSDWFKYLIIPYSNGLLSLKSTTVFGGGYTSSSMTLSGGNDYYLKLNQVQLGLFDYKFIGYPDNVPTYVFNSDTLTLTTQINFSTTFNSGTGTNLTLYIFLFKSGVGLTILDYKVWSSPTPGSVLTYNSSVDTIFKNGYYLYFDLVYDFNTANISNVNITINITNAQNNLLDVPIKIGDDFLINKILPSNIKQKDFLNSIFKLFNLYIDYDPNNTNILRIEPRDDYYYFNGPGDNFYGNPGFDLDNLQIKDWSDKVDINQEVNIQLLAETQNKTIKLSYKEDKDYFNGIYQGSINRIYGDKIIEIDNDFNFGEQVIDVLFGPTIVANIPGTINFPIANLTKQIDSQTNLPNGRSNALPKILQRSRAIDSNGSITGPSVIGLRNGDKWRMGSTTSDCITYSYYPYAGNINNPLLTDPYLLQDLNFDNAIFTYYSNNGISINNNLYNTFYKNQFEEILDVNSKILTAQLYLTPQDIRDFRFSDVIYLRLGSSGQYYHVNKINNYSLTEPYKTTEVELIKIKEVASYPLPSGTQSNNLLVMTNKTPATTAYATFSFVFNEPILSKLTVNYQIITVWTTYNDSLTIYPGTKLKYLSTNIASVNVSGYSITSIAPNKDGVYNYTF